MGDEPLRAYLERQIHISRVARLSAPADTPKWLNYEFELLAIPLPKDSIDLI